MEIGVITKLPPSNWVPAPEQRAQNSDRRERLGSEPDQINVRINHSEEDSEDPTLERMHSDVNHSGYQRFPPPDQPSSEC